MARTLALAAIVAVTFSWVLVPQRASSSGEEWDLEKLDERYHDAVRDIESREYKSAVKRLKDLKKLAGKERWEKEEKKRLSFLSDIASSLNACAKIESKKRVSHKGFEKVRATTHKNRSTFAFLRFLEMETSMRKQLDLGMISDFDPPLAYYSMPTGPFDFFSELEFPYTAPLGPGVSKGESRQGHFALRMVDTKDTKDLVFVVDPKGQKKQFPNYRYFCFNAKLESPGKVNLQVRLTVENNREYWTLKCGSWKGWRQHRLDFKKIGIPSRRVPNLSWEHVHQIRFAIQGDVSTLIVDDVHLCR